MLKGYFVFVFVFQFFSAGFSSSLLCGGTTELSLGNGAGAGAAIALALVRPPAARGPCSLRLLAPDAAAFTARLIDVKENLSEWERGALEVSSPALVAGVAQQARKWGARSATAQHTRDDQAPPRANATQACKLLVYIGDAIKPIWRMNLCGGNAAAVAARAGTKLLPPKIKIVWNPPTSPYQHTEKLRLVVTAVNSGSVCNNESQFICGMTSLCISSYLVCDGVRHCPGGEDEDTSACMHRRDPPLLELLRRFAARNQELLGIDQNDGMTKPSVISDLKLSVKITESEQKSNAFLEFAAALKPYGPWSYLVVGMLICATILMFCLAWECCCKRSKPSDTPINIPASCIDLSPTVTVTAASQHLFSPTPTSPPEYEPPPSYSSLFPRAYKCEDPVPQCSAQPD
ncbi:uncharacterized protein LOC125241649 isoform X1 [Leguminivora glycinivorella]|uniref:uncharacterized protein LOC125241649 isoform X1 n=1 Tax=Leguminivora glycinivorella TaxID=1035111 RepID=UPI00200FB8AD|nr:uncharacterized protein LOC125241649 isoform X1 [Leguminivora glycinivorella]